MQHGTPELPPRVPGHIGYAVVPWRQRKGYATEASRILLEDAKALGLPYLEVTTDPANIASQKVIERAGGTVHERFDKPASFGGGPGLRNRVSFHGA